MIRRALFGGKRTVGRASRAVFARGRWTTAAAVCAVLFIIWLRCGPLPPGLLESTASESTLVVDRDGVPLYEALSGDGTRSIRLAAGAIPDIVAAATIAAEDRRFWSHYGIDPVAVARAVKRNLIEGRVAEGGSTISQQVAKLMMLRGGSPQRRGWRAKAAEAILAIRLEHHFSKGEILAMYLNLASYGNQITGLERASRAYFGVESGMLTAAQAAFLAGLPQRPTAFNPYRSQDLATSRQRVVLTRMAAAGAITRQQAEEARSERLELVRGGRAFLAPHFVEMVLAQAAPRRSGRIATTLDSRLQEEVAGIIRSHRADLERHGAAHVVVVVLDNTRSEWLAWEGSGDYFGAERGARINGPIVLRQPGSALKPFTYALAFEEGFTPASVLPDVPLHFETAEPGVAYTPRNYDGRYRGPLLARPALAGSENIPAVALASELGVAKLLRFLLRAGFSAFDKTAAHYGLGITLGNAEVRLDELVAAYAAFARDGEWMAPTYLAGHAERAERRRLVSPRTAFWIGDILSDPDARAYIFGRGGSLDFPFPVAVKTGTSQAYHDNWTIGYTRRVTVGVWVGNFDRRPLRYSTGVSGAAPIFQAVMLAAHQRTHGIDQPLGSPHESLSAREICALSGETASSWCPVRRREWLPRDMDPVPCSWHHLTDEGVIVLWPPAFREWARGNGSLDRFASHSDPGPRAAGVQKASGLNRGGPSALRMVNPPPGAIYWIDPTLRREFQTLSFKVAAARPTEIQWSVDGALLGTRSSDSSLEWQLTRGVHRITARDGEGHVVESTVTVR